MKLRLFNTEGRETMDFRTITPGQVKLYACGPTVYNYAHIGNLRAYIVEDLLKRTLTFAGYEVNHVMNITDVGHLTDDGDSGEDKMIISSRERGLSPWEIADFYTKAFFNDTDRLNIQRPSVACKATEHIEQMIEQIKRIEANGYTYISGGNVYFDTSLFSGYGRMAMLDREGMKAGARIEVDDNKRNPEDFVLWFTNSKFEHHAMLWDSPWGKGYPGWHIECSAMSMHYLGEKIDIHCGGVDHVPVHHTNELAQAEAATGTKWVNWWVHNEFLIMNSEKMAKSSGNFLTLQSLADAGYDPMEYRYYLLGAHYRSQIQYSEESLKAAKAAYTGLVGRLRMLWERVSADEEGRVPAIDSLDRSASVWLESFESALAEDLNTPQGLSALWGLIKDDHVPDGDKLAAAYRMDEILGLRLREKTEEDAEADDAVAKLIAEREAARAGKNFARADEIRDELVDMGIVIEDTPNGTRWKRA